MEKQIYHVLKKIEDANFECYLVGGYVRDYLLKRKTNDIDICTNALPMDICNLFKNYDLTITKYGNVSLSIGSLDIEITTYRKDYYSDKRKPKKVEYITSLEEDLIRRDFTINAICMDKDKHIIDKLNARADLKKKIIRTIGDDDLRLKEDPLRIMRAIRFATVLDFRLSDNLKKAIVDNKHLLKELSYDRKKEELNKIFCSKNKKYGINLIKSLDLEEELDIFNVENVLLTDDLIGMWSLICDTSIYPFTKIEKDIIKKIKYFLDINWTDEVLYKYGIYPLSIACDIKKEDKKELIKRYDKLPIKDRKDIAISTDEICSLLEIEPGVRLKDIYCDLESKLLEKTIKNDSKSIKKYLTSKYL